MKEELCRNQCGFWVKRGESYCPWCGINYPVMPHPLFLRRMAVKILFITAVFTGLTLWKGFIFGFFISIVAAAFTLSLSVKLWNMWDLRSPDQKRFYEKMNQAVGERLAGIREKKFSAASAETLADAETLYQRAWSVGELARTGNEINAMIDNISFGAEEAESRLIVLSDRVKAGKNRFPGLFESSWSALEKFHLKLEEAVKQPEKTQEIFSRLHEEWADFLKNENYSLERMESIKNEADLLLASS